MKDNLLILMGPTAIGKTSLSIDLAKNLNGEIISSDSMQIYKYMNIGTAKVTELEMDGIPHHLVDFINPNEEYTVSNYQKDAEILIRNINNEGKFPIVVGGTGLYINSLVYELNFARVPPNESLRKKYDDLAEKYGNKYLHNKLMAIDIESSSKIEVGDRKRIIRALEIYDITGKTMSEYNKNFRRETDKYNLTMVCLNMDRSKLYDRINQRVDIMIKEGLIEEVQHILNMGYSKDLIALQGIGYKEVIEFLEGKVTMDTAIDKIKQGSRNYAKRQLTWFRRDKRIQWVNVDEFEDFNNLSRFIQNMVKSKLKD